MPLPSLLEQIYGKKEVSVPMVKPREDEYSFFSGILNPDANGRNVIMRLTNPPNSSPKVIIIIRNITVSNSAARLFSLGINSQALVDLETVQSSLSRNFGLSSRSSLTSSVGPGFSSTSIFHRLRVRATVPYAYDRPIELPLNSSVDMFFSGGDVLTTDEVTFNVDWSERAIL